MGIKIRREPFLKIEKMYRITAAATFYAVFAVILSAVVVVPLFASSTAYGILIFYSLSYFLYCLGLIACAVLAGLSCAKTKNEYLGVHCVLHIISTILAILNYKLFTALLLYGLKKDALAESFIGSDTDAFVSEASAQWLYLILALLLTCILAILSTVKLSKSKRA